MLQNTETILIKLFLPDQYQFFTNANIKLENNGKYLLFKIFE